MKKEIERLKRVVEELENKLLLICEMYYDDKDTEEMERWIKEIKGDKNGVMGKKKTN